MGGDFEKPIRRTQAFKSLVRTFVIVPTHPQGDPFPRRFETLELGAGEELGPDRAPKSLDLPQGHGVVGLALKVGDPILAKFRLEPTDASPIGILAPVVGEHFLRWIELADGAAIYLDDRLGRRAAKQIGPHNETRVIVLERDEVGVSPPKAEGEDVRLPHLVGSGALEKPRTGDVALFGRWARIHEASLMELRTNRFRTGRQMEGASQPLGDSLDSPGWVGALELLNSGRDGFRQLRSAFDAIPRMEPVRPLLTITAHPFADALRADLQFLRQQREGVTVFQVESNRLQF